MTDRTQMDTIPRGAGFRLDPAPRLVLFDLDDTLCDHAGSLSVRLKHAFEPLLPDPGSLARAVRAAEARSHEGTSHFAEVLGEFGVSDADAASLAAERYVSDRFRGLELYQDSIDGVRAIKQVAEIGLITNGPVAIQQPKIDLLEIESLFSIVLISEHVGIWKPDPAIFELALERTGIPSHEAMYVGDSPVHDVPGAHAAGLTAVWMNRAGIQWPGGPHPDVEVRDFPELVLMFGRELSRQ